MRERMCGRKDGGGRGGVVTPGPKIDRDRDREREGETERQTERQTERERLKERSGKGRTEWKETVTGEQSWRRADHRR